MRSFVYAALLGVCLVSCSEEILAPGEVKLEAGLESTLWPDPAPNRVRITTSDEAGEEHIHKEFDAPIDGFSLGLGDVSRFHLRASDGQGETLVSADSIFIDPRGVAERVVPLVAGPAGRMGRVDQLADSFPEPVEFSGVIARRYLFTVSGREGRLYDLGLWRASDPFDVPCPSASDCTVETVLVHQEWTAVFIGPSGASYLDFSTGETGFLKDLDGGSYADVSGGQVLRGPADELYVVGATRTSAPSDRVLRLDSDDGLTLIRLTSPRQGAAAAYLAGRGLLVVGGSATATGAEQLKPGADAFDSLDLPVDATSGAALFEADSGIFRVGGGEGGAPAPAVRLDLGCAAPCTLEVAGPPLASTRPVQLRTAENGDVLLLSEADGSAALQRVDASKLPVQLEPLTSSQRSAGLLGSLPTGQVALVGGDANGQPSTLLEVYFLR
ncbi:MAG: hypothetical protein R3B89_25975 [Polyangiaceae bacterium]